MSRHVARFVVRVTPRGGRDGVDGVAEGVLQVRVAASPYEGQANAAVIELLADELGVPRRDVRMVAGATGRRKTIAVDDIEPDALIARWPGLRV